MSAAVMLGLLLQILAFNVVPTPSEISYVRTTVSPSSDCPHQPCLTLHQYTQTKNFTTGMTLQFLPGNHTLQESTLNMTSISNITLRGEERNSDVKVNIVCTNVVTIQCENVTGLKIERLRFILNYMDRAHEITALKVINCRNVLILNATFLGNANVRYITRALFLQHSTATIRNSVFEGNVGGAIYVQDDSNLTICASSVTRNKGMGNIGAVYAQESTLLVDDSNFTHNSDNVKGGAIECNYNCSLEMRGINIFDSNNIIYVPYGKHHPINFLLSNPAAGGALSVTHGKLRLSGAVSFLNNTATVGGAVYLEDCDFIVDGEVWFINNSAVKTGGMTANESSIITTIKGRMRFIDNLAQYRAGALEINGNRKSVFSAILLCNRVIYPLSGAPNAAVSLRSARVITFVDTNVTGNHIGFAITNSTIVFSGSTRIMNNSGAGIEAESSVITFENNTLFGSNSNSALNCREGNIVFQGNTLFINNSADGDGGAIHALGTSIHMQGTVNFTLNRASNGGAMFFDNGASLTFRINTSLHASYNTALRYGGVIYHVDNPSIRQCYKIQVILPENKYLPPCFVQEEHYTTRSHTKISSHGNKAGIDGDLLFGGLLDRCTIEPHYYVIGNLLLLLFHPQRGEITSKPYELCICSGLFCPTLQNIQVYRGQKFTVPLLAGGQAGATPTTVTAITSSRAKLEIYQTSQLLPNYCHPLPYTLYSTDSHEEFVLYPDGPCRDTGTSRVVINVTLLPCPDGFTQLNELCTCEERLQHYRVNCTIADTPFFTKTANSNFWMGVLYANISYEGLVLAKSCPAEYCKTDDVELTLEDPDFQCEFNRSGLLCGACATHHSLMLGSSKCQVCPNTYLALLLPFAAAGIVLVVFLSFLRVTVATGTLNSVILYVNIVQANRKLFFPANTRNVLTVFVAWMNLDLGFQTCFYDGMDAYAQTWLQFAFPLYVWLLIALMIVVSRYSITLSKLIGHNPIAVLATLLLMSYTKILKIIIEVYSSADLDYPDNDTVTVWLKDANVPYLQSKHLFLTVVTSLVLIFFFLPYTFLLLLGHKLYLFTGRKHWHWLNRIKPLLDSYHAPYKIRTRYWTGFLLLIRCALYIVFLLNSLSASKSCLAIVLTFTAIEVIMGISRIYKKHYIHILEALVYLNLIVLSAFTQNGLNTPGLVYTLVALVLVVMALISAYQFHLLYIAKSALWQRLEREWSSRFRAKDDPKSNNETDTTQDPHNNMVTKTVIDLREPLMED